MPDRKMVSTEMILNDFGQQICNQLINDIESKQLTKYGAVNNTANLRDSVRWEVDGGTLRIFAAGYIFQMEHGRKPGKFPPKQPIIDWIKARGLATDISINSLAFLIQRKIARKGTAIFEQGGSDLVSGIINEGLVENIREALISNFNSSVIANFSSDILTQIAA